MLAGDLVGIEWRMYVIKQCDRGSNFSKKKKKVLFSNQVHRCTLEHWLANSRNQISISDTYCLNKSFVYKYRILHFTSKWFIFLKHSLILLLSLFFCFPLIPLNDPALSDGILLLFLRIWWWEHWNIIFIFALSAAVLSDSESHRFSCFVSCVTQGNVSNDCNYTIVNIKHLFLQEAYFEINCMLLQ
jgi:hypothetical protein